MNVTLSAMFTSEVQFGHAGSCANSDRETAVAKNKALADAGAHVPQSFDSLGEVSITFYFYHYYLCFLYFFSKLHFILISIMKSIVFKFFIFKVLSYL